jgi:glycosyltransferase involved in cell wall biosynthesis
MIDKSETPLVSISCIIYNHVHYIKDALDSFLMQKTDFSFEICLGEDESDDGTREICQEYAEKHPEKIRLFLRSRKDVLYIDGQATGSYNASETLKKCKGKYIALCEGDDYWIDPYKLQKQVDFLETNKEYVLTGGRGDTLEEDLGTLTESTYPNVNMEITRDYLFTWNPFHTASIFFRNININFPLFFNKYFAGDWMLYFLMTEHGKLYFSKEKYQIYRNHKGGITKSSKRHTQEIGYMKMLVEINEYFESKYNDILWKVNNAYSKRIYDENCKALNEAEKVFIQKWL